MNVDADLPGAELVAQGLADLRNGRETLASLVVSIGAPRLRGLGFEVPAWSSLSDAPELVLYYLLHDEDRIRAHSRYNALIRELVSFERAAEVRVRRGKQTSTTADRSATQSALDAKAPPDASGP